MTKAALTEGTDAIIAQLVKAEGTSPSALTLGDGIPLIVGQVGMKIVAVIDPFAAMAERLGFGGKKFISLLIARGQMPDAAKGILGQETVEVEIDDAMRAEFDALARELGFEGSLEDYLPKVNIDVKYAKRSYSNKYLDMGKVLVAKLKALVGAEQIETSVETTEAQPELLKGEDIAV